jgi:hypothetical protein
MVLAIEGCITIPSRPVVDSWPRRILNLSSAIQESVSIPVAAENSKASKSAGSEACGSAT